MFVESARRVKTICKNTDETKDFRSDEWPELALKYPQTRYRKNVLNQRHQIKRAFGIFE